jgi:hypothetical protein
MPETEFLAGSDAKFQIFKVSGFKSKPTHAIGY